MKVRNPFKFQTKLQKVSIRQKKKRAMKLLQRALLLLQKRANQQQKMLQRRRVNLQKVQLPKMKNLLKLQREKAGKPLHRILKLNKQKQQRVSLKHQNKLRLELRLQKEK